jgi:hypothetical protein
LSNKRPAEQKIGRHLRTGHLSFPTLRQNFSSRQMIKYTNQFLVKLEDLIAESDYFLRYEKGNFKSGYCLLRDQKIMIVNKFFTTEGKINILLEILRTVKLDTSRFGEKSLKLYEELSQEEVSSADSGTVS